MDQVPEGGAELNGSAASAASPDIASRLYRLLNGEREPPQSSFLPIAHELPIAVYITDLDGRVVYHNAAAAALWGCDPEAHDARWCGSRRLFTRDGEPLAHAQSPMAEALSKGASGSGGQLIAERRPGAELQAAARQEGMVTLREAALARARAGDTSLKEVNRVTFVD